MSDDFQGLRFSHVYVSSTAPLSDSKKARYRIAKAAADRIPNSKLSRGVRSIDHAGAAQDMLEREIGIPFASKSTAGAYVRIWDWYFGRITILEFLDSITILSKYLSTTRLKVEFFVSDVRRIFREENLAYEIDDFGGIHPLVDREFSKSLQSTVLSLGGKRYAATLHRLEQIDPCLLQDPPDYKGAIRASFGANENLFKLIYKLPRLDASSAQTVIGKALQVRHAGDQTQIESSAKLIRSFREWIDACHFYRHEEGVEEPSQPSPDHAIILISQGISYLRWMRSFDKPDE